MKKILLIASAMLILSGCGASEDLAENKPTSQNYQNPTDILGQQIVDGGSPTASANTSTKDFSAMSDVKADLDLNGMNEMMRSAMMSNLMYDPMQYEGQTIKVSGIYMPFESQEFDMTYHLLLYIDGSQCCTGMLEFVLPEGAEYPEENEEFLIFGEYKLMSDETGNYAIIEVTEFII